MMEDRVAREKVRRQFGDKAEAYAASALHATGASLGRLVELLQPQPSWRVLDVASGPGHTAHTLAPHVGWVVATDVTPPMLRKARALGREKGLGNVTLAAAAAELLPFAGGAFDLLTCRIAAHHFFDIARFLAEARRVLAPDGVLALVDNVVPGSKLRGRKGRVQREAGEYVNAFEKLRDPSHVRCLSIYGWRDAFYKAGFAIEHEELAPKEIAFSDWVARMAVAPDDVTRLRAMLVQAPREALEFLIPVFEGDTIKFRLSELFLIGKKQG